MRVSVRPETWAMPSPTCSTRPTCCSRGWRSSWSSRPCASGNQSSSVFESVRIGRQFLKGSGEVVAPRMAKHRMGEMHFKSGDQRPVVGELDVQRNIQRGGETLAATLPRGFTERERRDHADQSVAPELAEDGGTLLAIQSVQHGTDPIEKEVGGTVPFGRYGLRKALCDRYGKPTGP